MTLLYILFQVLYDNKGDAYYKSTPKTPDGRPTNVYITGDSSKASKSVKKQYREKTTPVVKPENLETKFEIAGTL